MHHDEDKYPVTVKIKIDATPEEFEAQKGRLIAALAKVTGLSECDVENGLTHEKCAPENTAGVPKDAIKIDTLLTILETGSKDSPSP